MKNIDPKTVEGFGEEWQAFDQSALSQDEHRALFERYFGIFPFETLPNGAEGFDLGCGSGRWAALAAPRVGLLHCIDPAEKALAVARRKLQHLSNVRFHVADVDQIPLPDNSQDFGYSLGVLHHIPDTGAALASCVAKLKVGAPFLLYIYYSFDNRPNWFRTVWKGSDVLRRGIARMPIRGRKLVTNALAALIYWPLARSSLVLERLGMKVENVPLSPYRHLSFYSMRTDSLDRFGTRLEQRFSRKEIEAMMVASGLTDIRFSETTPLWVAYGRKA